MGRPASGGLAASLRKPFDVDELMALLTSALDSGARRLE